LNIHPFYYRLSRPRAQHQALEHGVTFRAARCTSSTKDSISGPIIAQALCRLWMTIQRNVVGSDSPKRTSDLSEADRVVLSGNMLEGVGHIKVTMRNATSSTVPAQAEQKIPNAGFRFWWDGGKETKNKLSGDGAQSRAAHSAQELAVGQ